MTDPAQRTIVVLTTDSTFLSEWGNSDPRTRLVRVPWIDGEQALPAQLLSRQIELTGAHGLCIGPDVPEDLTFAVAEDLDERAALVGTLLVRTPTPEMWRRAALSGVRDVLPPTSTIDEIRRSLAEVTERVDRQRFALHADDAPTGRILVVLSPKGGSGKTMVATNLAVALATGGVGDTALVDLDCVFGDVASVLGMVPERTIGQLAALPTIDSTTTKVFLTRHDESGVQVLAGSGLPEEGEAVTPDIARDILQLLARDFPIVVVDTAAGLDERALAAVDMATDLIFVASLDVTSIRNLGKEIDALNRLGLTGAARTFILNRADAKVGLEVNDVEKALGMPAAAALPSSRSVPLSMNQGQTLVLSEPASMVATQIKAVARRFSPALSELPAGDDGGRSRRFRRR